MRRREVLVSDLAILRTFLLLYSPVFNLGTHVRPNKKKPSPVRVLV